MNESKPTAPAGGDPRRRRVLRGAISAPVVLTISSGVSASSASNLRCVQNQVRDAATRTYPAGTGVPSTIIRVPLYRNTAGTMFFINGTDVNALAHPSRPVGWISDGQYRQFIVNENRLGTTVTTTQQAVTSPVQYANIQVNQQGFIISVGRNTTLDTSLIAATCWNSFRAGP